MWTYILKRLLLMIPTGVGIITVFFIVSEMVPGGPLDQVEAMILSDSKGAEGGSDASDIDGEIDPQTRMVIKRKLGLNHNRLERYLRMLVWYGRDSFISSREIAVGESRKVHFNDTNMIVYRSESGYHVYKKAYKAGEKTSDVAFDKKANVFASTADPSITFDPTTGKQHDGELSLEPIAIEVRNEVFDEFDYKNGIKVPVKEEREELYLKTGIWSSLTDWDNWHGYFLLKFPNSITKNKKSYELIAERLPISARLGVSSFFITYICCIILGVAKAVKNGTKFDSLTSVVVLIGYSIPGFVLAVFLLKLFGPGSDSLVHALPLRGIHSQPDVYNNLSFWGKLWDNIHHMIAPVLCLTVSSFAGLTMLTKNSVMEQFHQLYAVAARARGLSEKKVLYKHVLRNSLIPLVTGFPARFVMMFFAGAVLIEKIFNLDGMGLLSYTALLQRDYPLMISNIFVFTYIGLICRLLADIGYVIVDPRISFEKSTS